MIDCVFHTWWDYSGIVKDYWILTLHRNCTTNMTDFCFYQSFLTNTDEECDQRNHNNNITTTTRTRPTDLSRAENNIWKTSTSPLQMQVMLEGVVVLLIQTNKNKATHWTLHLVSCRLCEKCELWGPLQVCVSRKMKTPPRSTFLP